MKALAFKKINDYARDFTSLGNPVLLVLFAFFLLGVGDVFLIFLGFMIANECIVFCIKFLFYRKRPNGQTYSTMLEKIEASSFPSWHAARVSLALLFLGMHFAVLHFTIPLILIVAFTRVYLKKHYWTDVFGGLILGSLLFYVMYVFFL